ncbi:hypothetical protein [Martelella sp. FOR1707]
MVSAISGPFNSSANAGQLSEDLFGKVNLKQYYSGAQRMLGVEPVPQSGFQLMPGTVYAGPAPSGESRMGVLRVNGSLSYTLIFTAGQAEIWRNDMVKVATVSLPAITSDLLPTLKFYGEANTFGIFAQSIWSGIRLFRDENDDTNWTVTDWPYEYLPELDLGGSYTKTDDIWEIFLRWDNEVNGLVVAMTVDGVDTASVDLVDGSGDPISPGTASETDWGNFANALADAISDLSGFEDTVSAAISDLSYLSSTGYIKVVMTFSGALSGSEYGFNAQVVNTSSASSLVGHVQIGKTDGEPLISASRGGFAGMEIYQDRAVYYAPKAKQAALNMSQVGEYFTLNIETERPNDARLEALRTDTSERVTHLLDDTYLVIFTDQAEYFLSNRKLDKSETLNFVRASKIGSSLSCAPVTIDGRVYFFSTDGSILYSTVYDAVSTTYTPEAVNDLNRDLLQNAAIMAVQSKTAGMKWNRLWVLRQDGRMICAIVNKAQEIVTSAAEWQTASGGTVKSFTVDGQQNVWLIVQRGGQYFLEVMREASETLFQATINVTTDGNGIATGLSALEGRTVWADLAGDIHGPFTVSGGQIDTDAANASGRVGLWQAPVFETLPYVRVLRNDDIVRRPGCVKWVRFYLLDSTSVAIGANGQPAKDVPLQRFSDDLSGPRQGRTGHITIAGLKGATMDPTLTITQTRPGRLRLRDFVPGVKL